jgi:hypothetical protein
MVLWGGLVAVLGVGTAPAQLFNELMRGAILNVPTDMFGCGTVGTTPCGLRYRTYSAGVPSEVNSPANPADGIPRYGAANTRYISDTVSTANYPLSAAQGPGNTWYTVWDGITGAGTSAHAGWYGGQSQKVNSFELGNSLSLNCLPVTSQEACFAALNVAGGGNDSDRADGSSLNRVGGISPIPCPQVDANGLSSVDLSWEQADNGTSRDGASSAIVGTRLYAVLDPTAAQTDGDLSSGAVAVGDFPAGTTSASVSRSDAALVAGSVFSFANKVLYAGGKESFNFSCNSAHPGGGLCTDDVVGDANSAVDIERICADVRTEDGVDYVVLTYDIVGDAAGVAAHDRIQYTALMNGGVARFDARALNATQSARQGDDVVIRFDAAGPEPLNYDEFSQVDNDFGRVVFVINADDLEAMLGGRTFSLDAKVKVPGKEDSLSLSYSF